jgi:hypothetical protein
MSEKLKQLGIPVAIYGTGQKCENSTSWFLTNIRNRFITAAFIYCSVLHVQNMDRGTQDAKGVIYAGTG